MKPIYFTPRIICKVSLINGVMMMPKRWLFTIIFACLCLSKSLLIKTNSLFIYLCVVFNNLFSATLVASCVMDLRHFPMDSQTCHLKFGSCKYCLWSSFQMGTVPLKHRNLISFVHVILSYAI